MGDVGIHMVDYYVDEEAGRFTCEGTTAQIFYSQSGEDLEVYGDFFHHKQELFKGNGTFVEVGAGNGVKFSNTKYFEDHMGFNGLLVEPVPDQFDMLVKTRASGINMLARCAVTATEGNVTFRISDHPTAGLWVSGVDSTLPQGLRELWHQESHCIEVPSKKMSTLIEMSKLKYIDIFSLDVEGGELEVLKSMDWKVPIYIFIIELRSNGLQTEKDGECRDILLEHGFCFHKSVGLSEIWYDKEYLSKRHASHCRALLTQGSDSVEDLTSPFASPRRVSK